MLEMKVTIAPTAELAAVLEKLASAIGGADDPKQVITESKVPVNPMETVPAQNARTMPTAAVTAAPVPAQMNAAPIAPAVPTGIPQYTLEMISNAGTALVDAGKMAELLQLLAKYGVNALTELKPETYGSVAAELRALGAQI